MECKNTEKLSDLLLDVKNLIPSDEFCGVGVILYYDLSGLPILPLCPEISLPRATALKEQIVYVSLASNPCHDGFHLLSTSWKLTHTNQYFAPPLISVPAKELHGNVSRGARYISALLGSKLENVCCIGILSDSDGLVIFKNGKELK